MPKMKTHKGAAARFKKTKKGKIMRRHAYLGHLMRKKSKDSKRRKKNWKEVDDNDKKRLKKLLPYS
jgi:large subunit ribosomal protein L35